MNSNLVFLCGFPSSGTDLLKNIINAHTNVYISGEFPFLQSLYGKYGPTIPADKISEVTEALKKLDVYHNFKNIENPFPVVQKQHSLSEIYAHLLIEENFQWKGNKTPQNTENIDKLKFLFPEAKFIVIVRDIRDVVLSWEKKWEKNKLLCAYKWNHRMKKGYGFIQEMTNESVLLLKYEDLLDNFYDNTRRICTFLGIEHQERMFHYYEYITERLIGKINYGKPLVKNNQKKWKAAMSRYEIKRIEEISFESLNFLNYPITIAKKYRPLNAFEKFYGVAQELLSLIFVDNREIERNRYRHRLNTILFEIKKHFFYRSSL